MSVPTREALDAITAWVDQNSQRAQRDSVRLTLQQGHVPDGSRRKATLSLETGQKVTLIEAWSSGEMDFTLHDFSLGDEGHSTHIRFTSFEEMEEAIERCYAQFTG